MDYIVIQMFKQFLESEKFQIYTEFISKIDYDHNRNELGNELVNELECFIWNSWYLKYYFWSENIFDL